MNCLSILLHLYEFRYYLMLYYSFLGNYFFFAGEFNVSVAIAFALLYRYPTLFSTSYKRKNTDSPTSPLPTNSNHTRVFP